MPVLVGPSVSCAERAWGLDLEREYPSLSGEYRIEGTTPDQTMNPEQNTNPYRHVSGFLRSLPIPVSAAFVAAVLHSSVLVANKQALSHIDRHRGGGHPPTPATPPCVRVRTRRFETVTLTVLEQ